MDGKSIISVSTENNRTPLTPNMGSIRFIPWTTSIHWNTKAEIRKDSGGLLLAYLRFAFGKIDESRAVRV